MKEQEVILVGAGGHALSITEFALPYIKGYLAHDISPLMQAKRLGDDDDLDLFLKDFLFHIAFVYSGAPDMTARRKLIEKYERKGARFATFIAPSAIVTPNAVVEEGASVMAGAIVNRAVISSHAVVNSGAIVEHDCLIGKNSFIGPGAVIGGFTRIGQNCFIGLGARIKNGVNISDNVSIAMGSIITRDILEPGLHFR